mgnify:CR=1 FL=1
MTPYQIGRLWADEHYPRAKKKRGVQPLPSDSDSGGPYKRQRLRQIDYLPPPEPAPVDPVTSHPLNLRIPESVRAGNCFSSSIAEDQLLAAINSKADQPIAELLAENQRRWAAIRKEHLMAYRENVARYQHSFDILEQIFFQRVDEETQKKCRLVSRLEYPKYEPRNKKDDVEMYELTNTLTFADHAKERALLQKKARQCRAKKNQEPRNAVSV